MASVKSTGLAPKRSRAEWYEEFSRLKSEGMNGLEIAVHLGVASSFVYDVLGDPTRAKDRKRKKGYGLRCLGCGKRTDGSNGRDAAPRFCLKCLRARKAPKHGTASRYTKGCRCDRCKRANAERMRAYYFATGQTAVPRTHPYQPHTGKCRGCGAAHDERTRGCSTCANRHFQRKKTAA